MRLHANRISSLFISYLEGGGRLLHVMLILLLLVLARFRFFLRGSAGVSVGVVAVVVAVAADADVIDGNDDVRGVFDAVAVDVVVVDSAK